MELTERTQIKISYVIIIILILLSIKVYYSSLSYDCNQCSVSFISERANIIEENPFNEKIINISVNELHKYYVDGKCVIFWDKENGYMKDGRL